MHPRICDMGAIGHETPETLLQRIAALGFDTVLAHAEVANSDDDTNLWRERAEACQTHGLSLIAHLDVAELDLHHPLVKAHPDCFAVRYEAAGETIDPRDHAPHKGRATLRAASDALAGWWALWLDALMDAGVCGLCAGKPSRGSAPVWQSLIAHARSRSNRDLLFVADTPGTCWDDWPALKSCGFDFTLSSLPWWDGRSNWLVEEHEALSRLAPPIAQVDAPGKLLPSSLIARRSRVAIAALTGAGIMMPAEFVASTDDDALAPSIESANRFVAAGAPGPRRLAKPTGAGANLTVLMRVDGADERLATCGYVCLINPEPNLAADAGAEVFAALGDFDALEPVAGLCTKEQRYAPGEARLFRATRAPAIRRHAHADVAAATRESRLVIENVSPVIDDGRYPTRRIVGERIEIEADVYADGHPVLAADLVWRADDEKAWKRTKMRLAGNDRWQAPLELARIGRTRFVIEAWLDRYGSFAHDLAIKRDAGQDLSLETSEGLALVRDAGGRVNGTMGAALKRLPKAFEHLAESDRVALLLAPETMEAMYRAGERLFLTRSREYGIEAERKAARFSSWYELFPRSQTSSADRSGTFRDTIERLPDIRDMGFDVLYLTPIHPIGITNRKGRNNALKAEPDDPGSPYAIGAAEGGHDAIHPALGTLEDFRALVLAASEHGMEIALDFAIQCSPDHPWLKEHPGWFAWRADGSIRFAENPPKKYEDIVNIDFYAGAALPGAWLALRDVVLHWIDAGVRIFRVDNPHTKPFAFWEWLIADIRTAHPNTIFLSEAFTRPKVMYHLAKIGFSQSYTYFTWRNSKRELTEYLTELTRPPVCDFFRPHLFVNTPDIDPFYLQHSGRAGFLSRAALAATLSGLWGMYSGFELCEAAGLPGREEYLDSEKYEVKPRDYEAPGNIKWEIAQLNRLRKAEPALQTHLGLTFYNAFNDHILYYGKHAPGHRDRILVAVNLDPHGAQECDFEIPLWEWGLPDHEALDVEDMLRGNRFVWRGKIQHVRLTPEAPYAIWRMAPSRER